MIALRVTFRDEGFAVISLGDLNDRQFSANANRAVNSLVRKRNLPGLPAKSIVGRETDGSSIVVKLKSAA